MIPGMGEMLGAGGGDMAGQRMKRMLYITDSMSAKELDSDGSCFTTRLPPAPDADPKAKPPVRVNARALRVAKGSGTSVREVEEFLIQYRTIGGMVKKMGGKAGMFKQMQGRRGGAPSLPPGAREQAMRMQNALPPEIKAQLRQPGGRERLMQQIQSGNIPPGLAGMAGMGGLGGLGGMGGGGMPDMAQMQQMMQNMGGLGGMMQRMMGGGA